MTKTTYTVTKHGRYVSNETLKIFLPDHVTSDALRKAEMVSSHIFTGAITTKLPMSGNYWLAQVQKLVRIANDIVSMDGKYKNIFEHMPVTKTGKWPKHGTRLLATTDCEITRVHEDIFDDFKYPLHMPLQLRLVYGEDMDDVAVLRIGYFAHSRQKPVFDIDGDIRKDVKCGQVWLARMTYLTGQIPHETVVKISGPAQKNTFHFRDLESETPFEILDSKDMPFIELKQMIHA